MLERLWIWGITGAALLAVCATASKGSAQLEGCIPACPEGTVCEAGGCVAPEPACEPACAAGSSCRDGTCVPDGTSADPAPAEGPPGPSPSPAGTPGSVAGSQPGVQPNAGVQPQPGVQPNAGIQPQGVQARPDRRRAEVDRAAEEGYLPQRYSNRPLNLPRGTVSPFLDFGLGFTRFDFGEGSDLSVGAGMNLGVSLGIIDGLEVGLVPLSISLKPDVDALNPLFYLQGAFVRTRRFQMGIGYRINLPLRSDTSYFDNQFSLNLRLRGHVFRFDAIFYAQLAAPLDESLDFVATPGIQLGFTLQVAPIVALRVAFNNSFFDADAENYALSVLPGIVVTVPGPEGSSPIMDLQATAGLIGVVTPEGGSTDFITLNLTATLYIDAW